MLPSLVVLLLAFGCRPAPAPVPAPPRVEETVHDPSVLVFVHSFSGHTAAAGREIADMLGGRFIRVNDEPKVPDIAKSLRPKLSEVLATVDMRGVRRLFVGFPVYNNAPSDVAREIIGKLELKGVRVTPVFTYVHFIDPQSLVALAEEIRGRGGIPEPAIGLRLPALIPDEEIVERARRAILGRRDLWPEEPPATPACAEAAAPHSVRMCAVPAGGVWVGDVSANPPPGAPPPRYQTLKAFDLDEKEVTVAQYARCVAAHKCRARPPHGVSEVLEKGGDAMPMPDLSWSDAASYCAFAGLRLPTEAEWTRAARGSGLTAYPWGNEPPGQVPARANLGEQANAGLPEYAFADPPWAGDGTAGLSPGCHYPAGNGPFGHCDLIGNLLEWVDGPVPTGKGGSWIDVEPAYVSIAAHAISEQRNLGSYLTGARCARSQ